jgi:ATP-binding cassette subfamily E protein 1
MFDEPSSYLDVKQRLSAAKIIRSLLRSDDYVICVEHDLSVLDYLSDFICVLYGKPAVYGVVTLYEKASIFSLMATSLQRTCVSGKSP